MNSETDDELVLILEVNYHGEYLVQTISYCSWETLTVASIIKQLTREYELESENHVWLVYKGRKLKENELAKDIGTTVVRPFH